MSKGLNILFLTITQFPSIASRGIYTDLMREFKNRGHRVFVVNPVERKYNKQTALRTEDGVSILDVWTFNLQKTNVVEKGIGTLSVEYQFYIAINKYFSDVKFDLILYSTPPITFSKVVRSIKEKSSAISYLLLKDIFPQNAVDIGLIKKHSLLHKFFEKKEQNLYKISDYIGCMSPANVEFLLSNNSYLQEDKVEVCPNSIELKEKTSEQISKEDILKSYNVAESATTFIYGGNLGKPQGIGFLLDVLEANNNKADRFFFIVGNGTEYGKLEQWFNANQPSNALLISGLPKEEYDKLLSCCDVGLIFLDRRFTIPNYPSRLLSYLEYKQPVLMATDKNTDIGRIAETNGYGFWTKNGNLKEFNYLLDKLSEDRELVRTMGEKGYKFLKENYTVDKSVDVILDHFLRRDDIYGSKKAKDRSEKEEVRHSRQHKLRNAKKV